MKYPITLLLILCGCLPTGHAQCISGNCQNGTGVFVFEDGSRYVGQFQNGKSHGNGTRYYPDGSRYQGSWVRGKAEGKGLKVTANGDKKQGLWEKGRMVESITPRASRMADKGRGMAGTGCVSGNCQSGNGIYIYSSGAVYVGEFKGGQIHGVGVCYYSDGSKYQGEWKNRRPDGKGTKTYPDGRTRTGYWRRGQPVSRSGQLEENGRTDWGAFGEGNEIQTGCLSGNCQNGVGLYAYPNGSRYRGQFYQGKPHGQGAFFYADGKKYVGAFQEGFPQGEGKLIDENGQVQTGIWEQGEYLNDDRQKGCIRGNCSDGRGTYVYQDGSKYVGQFKNDLPHGRGVVYYTNGERYEGEMARASFNGQGTLYLEDGTRINGYWKDGVYQGKEQASHARANSRPQANPVPDIRVWAVIIGVSSYDHMPVLRYTDDDAYRIYAFLKSPEGGALKDEQIRILIDEDATKKNITQSMREVFGQAGPNDLVMLYFSGHGLRGSFLPIDFDGYNNKLYHEEINRILKNSGAKYKLCIADACHSGSLLKMRGGSVRNTLKSYYENLARAQPGTALIMSSKSDETSLESSGLRQGVFSHFLIRGMKGEADVDRDRVVTVSELYRFVHQNVRRYTGNRQSPVIQGDYDKDMTIAVKE